MSTRFKLQLGDISTIQADAIVTSAAPDLLSGGPVHAAVHRAAGPDLASEVEALGGCPVGEARITDAYGLNAHHVIHTVPPTWVGGRHGELEALAACYRSALRLAEARGLQSIAFPSLGSGMQPQIPLHAAAPVVIETMLDWVAAHALPEKIILVCYDTHTFQIHQTVLKKALP